MNVLMIKYHLFCRFQDDVSAASELPDSNHNSAKKNNKVNLALVRLPHTKINLKISKPETDFQQYWYI